jgi:hypothetical protein
MVEREAMQARLRRAEVILAEADRLLQRRRTELGGAEDAEFEDRLLQGVREIGAVMRDLLAAEGGMASVSSSHAAELAATADHLDEAGHRGRRART